MSTGLVMESGTPLPVELPDKNVININIHHESSVAYLCRAVGRCWAQQREVASKAPQPSASAPTSSARRCCGGEHNMPGGVQILLGIVCISLGVVVEYENVFYNYIRSGAAFWMGGLFILSGIFSVVGNRCGGYWIPVATVFNLASVVAAIVALTKGIASIPDLTYFYNDKMEMCKKRTDPWMTAPSPGHYDWEVENCKYMLWHLLAVAFSVRVLLLIFSAAALAVTLFCFGYGIRVMYLKARSDTYTEVGDQEVPPPYEDLSRPETIP